jgi:hypothetical protein
LYQYSLLTKLRCAVCALLVDNIHLLVCQKAQASYLSLAASEANAVK